jgi:RNase P/RNase MRP subunit POP5
MTGLRTALALILSVLWMTAAVAQSRVQDPAAAEDLLKQVIAELQEERIVASRYSLALAREIERQRSVIVPTLRAAGTLRELIFVTSTMTKTGQEIDQFIADHGNVRFRWLISIDPSGVIDVLYIQPEHPVRGRGSD